MNLILGLFGVLALHRLEKGSDGKPVRNRWWLVCLLSVLFSAASAEDGTKLAEWKITSPTVFDGMAAADGRLYLSLQDGSVVCFAGR